MREQISRRLLSRFEKKVPDFFRRRQLQVLMDLAAESFDVPKEKLRRGSAEKALRQYAGFTCLCMKTGAVEEEKLFRDAQRLGKRIRQITGLTDDGDLHRLIILLYRNIGIRMSIKGSLGTDHAGEVTVSDCYFSRVYSPKECGLMSFVDSGIVSGICGGGKLRFSQRITEGCESCRACFAKDEMHLHGGKENE